MLLTAKWDSQMLESNTAQARLAASTESGLQDISNNDLRQSNAYEDKMPAIGNTNIA